MNLRNGQIPVYWLLVQLAVKTKHDFGTFGEEHSNLTVVQLFTLCLLEANEPRPMNTISHQLACDASNVTGIVDRLESHNLIVRRDDPHDRRIKLITLTEKGLQLRDSIFNRMHDFAPQGFAKLSPEEQYQLYGLLQKALAPAKDR